MQSIVISMSVCLTVYLSAHISQKPQSKFHHIFVHVICGSGLVHL